MGIQAKTTSLNIASEYDSNEDFKEAASNSDTIVENKSEIKTKQPNQVREPKAFISKDEKIELIQAQNKNAGYQRKEGESDCKTYFCSSNFCEVLDIPNWRTLLCCCCFTCCDSAMPGEQGMQAPLAFQTNFINPSTKPSDKSKYVI